MAELPVFSPGYDGDGFVTQAAASGGDQFENTGDAVLWLQNDGAAAITVTLTPEFDPAGLLFAPVAVVLAAGQVRLVGTLLRQWWSDGAGKVTLAYSGVNGLSVGVMQAGPRVKYDGAGFLPSAVPGLVMWLDGAHLPSLFQDDAGVTPVVANNDPVGRWLDRSGINNFVSQATTTAKPTYQTNVQNGLAGLLFDGGDYLDNAVAYNSFPLTILGVAKQSGVVGTTRGLVSLHSSVTFGTRVSLTTANQVSGFIATPSSSRTAPGSVAANGAFVFGSRFSGLDLTARLNRDFSSSSAHAAGAVANNIDIGRLNVNSTANLMNGHICEILIYNTALTPSQMERLGKYLNAKWGVY